MSSFEIQTMFGLVEGGGRPGCCAARRVPAHDSSTMHAQPIASMRFILSFRACGAAAAAFRSTVCCASDRPRDCAARPGSSSSSYSSTPRLPSSHSVYRHFSVRTL